MHEVGYNVSDPACTGVQINGLTYSLYTRQLMIDGAFT